MYHFMGFRLVLFNNPAVSNLCTHAERTSYFWSLCFSRFLAFFFRFSVHFILVSLAFFFSLFFITHMMRYEPWAPRCQLGHDNRLLSSCSLLISCIWFFYFCSTLTIIMVSKFFFFIYLTLFFSVWLYFQWHFFLPNQLNILELRRAVNL